ncbi:recombination endonuclease VI [Vibrio phage vB_ValC_WD615]|nr:recombination endonuclease VI [Vibrio phage vB_ValC_WD615]
MTKNCLQCGGILTGRQKKYCSTKCQYRYCYHNTKGRKEAQRNAHYKHRFGISWDDKIKMLESQGNVCKVCGTDKPGGQGHWHLDHCHNTGKVRGILCMRCNVVLGQVEDNVEILEKLGEYLCQSRS